MGSLIEQRENCTCLVCGDMYTDPRRLECGHVFCLQCLVDKTECPDPDCKSTTVPVGREGVRRLRADEEMADRVAALIREGVNAFGLLTLARKRTNYSLARMGEALVPLYSCDHCDKDVLTLPVYICGMCKNYGVCEDCWGLPVDKLHNPEHVFYKLRRKITCPIELGPHLKQHTFTALTSGGDNSAHACVRCSCCGAEPISGVRFKCGMCDDYNLCAACEERSLEIHSEFHVFVILRNPCTAPPGSLIRVKLFDTLESPR